MPSHSWWVRLPLLAACLVMAAAAVPVAAAPAGGSRAPAGGSRGASVAAQASPALSPVTFIPAGPGASETVRVVFPPSPGVCPPNQPQPFTASYPGTLEVGREANGNLYLISQLTFSDYLKGIAEVPASWPMAALEAQVVAARTYAISHMDGPTVDGLNYNLCSTDACQVYRGSQVEEGPWGEEWDKAVDATAGQILQYQGRPIDALYFSTSNGHTYSNADVFGGSPLPYLQPVAENDDTGSPESSWSVRMPLTDLAQTLAQAGKWGSGPITSVSQQANSVVIAGPGQSLTMSISSFRNALNNNATCLTPKRYPTPSSAGGNLPQVVPSIWMTLSQQNGAIVMTGRGWGHGVGMVQWGAKGKADRGLSYRDILAYYYGGLKPVTVAEPGSIRVLLATGVQQVTVAPKGSVQEKGGPTGTLTGAVTITGGPSMTIAPAPVMASGGAIAPTLSLTTVTATPAASAGSPAVFSFTLNHPATVGLTYALSGATPTVTSQGSVAPTPLPGGPQSLTWDPSAAGLPPGAYEVALVANDGISQVVSPPLPVTLRAPSPSASPPRSPGQAAGRPSPGTSGPTAPLLVAGGVVVVLLAAGIGGFVLTRRRSP